MSKKKNPLEATSDPKTWTRTQKIGLAIMLALVVAGLLIGLADSSTRLGFSILLGILVGIYVQEYPDADPEAENATWYNSWLFPLFRDVSLKTSLTIPLASLCMFLARIIFFPFLFFFLGGVRRKFMGLDILLLGIRFDVLGI